MRESCLKTLTIGTGGNARPIAVRVREGKTLMTDGPFAETREQLTGYYVIDAKDLDEATMIAGKIPGARSGTIEVRPILLMEQADLQRFGRAS